MQNEVNETTDWININKLSTNTAKTESLKQQNYNLRVSLNNRTTE